MSNTRGFWRLVKKLFTVNPEVSDGVYVREFRRPAPGSPINKYEMLKTKNSDVADNYYFKRDMRRAFPREAIYSQQEVAGLLLAAHAGSLPAPSEASGETSVTARTEGNAALTEALAKISQNEVLYDAQKLPPLPNWNPSYQWKVSTDPSKIDPDSYFPMRNMC
ncbi:uncharacterized protein VTP21DRAFT_9301 [Calcarisporiella thermophila]|uniref:uncharacterized protein n=1 Tax=Calcarisporiella thermophila TaxID=911321 RepID=UPI0037434619